MILRTLLLMPLLLWQMMTLAQTLKSLYPRVGPEPDVSRTAQERYEVRKAKYDQLVESMHQQGLSYEALSHEDQKLLDAEMELMPESIYDFEEIGCSWYCGGGPEAIVASSHLDASGSLTYLPEHAHDFKLNTAWVEGVPGHGAGEYIEYRFASQGPYITTVMIYNGYGKSERLYRANSRPRELRLLVNGKPYAMLNLADSRGKQTFKLGEEIPTANLRLRFEVVSAYPGEKYDDLCITDITFDGTGVHCFAAGTPVVMADGTEKAIEDLVPGDQIMSREQGQPGTFPATIEALAQQQHHNLVQLTLEDGTKLTLTPDHPLLGANGNWVAVDPERAARYVGSAQLLTVGTAIQAMKDKKRVIRVADLPGCQPTYTIIRLSRGNLFLAGRAWSATEPTPMPTADPQAR